MPNAKPAAFIILVIWLSLLFSTIGIAASDFLCINLSTIASILGMSESLTGVTFLAFGNGSPDVFSTFAAMSSNSGSLAVGELMGAACFITAVVAGSMALVKPFNVARRSFLRDIIFFTFSASFSLVFLIDGRLRLWECAAMIGFYAFYVLFVVTWHWWQGKKRKRRLKEAAARLHQHIPDTQELEVPDLAEDDEESRPAAERPGLLRAASGDALSPIIESEIPAWKLEDIDEDNEARDRYLAELQRNMRVTKPGRRERRSTMTPIRPSLIGVLEFRSVLNSLEKKSTQTPNINLRRYSEDPSQFLGQSASQPELLVTPSHDRESLQDGPGGRSRAVSVNNAAGIKIDTHLLDIPGSIPETAVYSGGLSPQHNFDADIREQVFKHRDASASPRLVISPADEPTEQAALENGSPGTDDLLGPPSSSLHPPNYTQESAHMAISPLMSPQTSPVPKLKLPRPRPRHSPLSTSFQPYTDSPDVLTPAGSRPPSLRLPAPSISPESSAPQFCEEEEEEEVLRRFRWWPYTILPAPQVITSTVFPTLYGWHEKGFWDKLLGLVTAPSVFLLTITLPVVEPNSDEDNPIPDPGLLSPELSGRSRSNSHSQIPTEQRPSTTDTGPPHPHQQAPGRQVSFASPKQDVEVTEGPKTWNRWLVFLQVFTAPLFIVVIVWANTDKNLSLHLLTLLVLGSLIFSLVCLLVLLATTTADHEPRYRPLFCFLGFAVAIAWISTIANEVVGVLKAFGVIIGISDAILGLTIFAVGNSVGDLVADITVARLGYPVMALSACFGGPMLNILLGIGISGLYMTIRNGTRKHAKHPDKPVKYKPFEVDVGTSLIISGVTLLVTLIGLLIVVPLNGWRMDRKIGTGLIVLWGLSTIGNVIVEIVGYGGDVYVGTGGALGNI